MGVDQPGRYGGVRAIDHGGLGVALHVAAVALDASDRAAGTDEDTSAPVHGVGAQDVALDDIASCPRAHDFAGVRGSGKLPALDDVRGLVAARTVGVAVCPVGVRVGDSGRGRIGIGSGALGRTVGGEGGVLTRRVDASRQGGAKRHTQGAQANYKPFHGRQCSRFDHLAKLNFAALSHELRGFGARFRYCHFRETGASRLRGFAALRTPDRRAISRRTQARDLATHPP